MNGDAENDVKCAGEFIDRLAKCFLEGEPDNAEEN